MGEYILGKIKRFYTNYPRQENIIQIFQQGVAPGAPPPPPPRGGLIGLTVNLSISRNKFL